MSRIEAWLKREQAWKRAAECPSVERLNEYEQAIDTYHTISNLNTQAANKAKPLTKNEQ